MKNFISVFLALNFITITILSGCGGVGKTVDPVKLASPNDADKTCEQLSIELDEAKKICEINKQNIKKWSSSNIMGGLGVMMFFFPVLISFDPNNTDDVNYANSVEYYNYLISLCEKKNCETEYKIIKLELPKKVRTNFVNDNFNVVADPNIVVHEPPKKVRTNFVNDNFNVDPNIVVHELPKKVRTNFVNDNFNVEH